jgi:phage gp36-like protein
VGSYETNGQQYATTTDLANAIASAALTHPSTGTTAQNAQLLRASEFIDGYLRSQYTLPLNTWGSDVVDKCCDIAAYHLVCLRGFNPEADGHFLENYKMAIKWLESVSMGKITLDVLDSSPAAQVAQHAPDAQPQTGSPNPSTRCTRER